MASLESCPPEVLHQIISYLSDRLDTPADYFGEDEAEETHSMNDACVDTDHPFLAVAAVSRTLFHAMDTYSEHLLSAIGMPRSLITQNDSDSSPVCHRLMCLYVAQSQDCIRCNDEYYQKYYFHSSCEGCLRPDILAGLFCYHCELHVHRKCRRMRKRLDAQKALDAVTRGAVAA